MTTTTTYTVKLTTTDWRDGSLAVYGARHTIHADAIGVGSIRLVFDCDRRARKFRFVGCERVKNNPASEFCGDLPPLIQSLGSDSIAKATWLRLYREDAQRRSHYE